MNGRQLSALLRKCAIPKSVVKPIVKLTKSMASPHRLIGRRPVEYCTSSSSRVLKALTQIEIDGYWRPENGDILMVDEVVSECAKIYKRQAQQKNCENENVHNRNLFAESDFVDCPALLKFVIQDSIVQIASNYLGMMPVVGDFTLWWSLPSKGEFAGSQLFHQDKIDDKQLKLFLNINDIGDANGPFCFFPGSASKQITSVASDPLGRISDEEIKLSGVSELTMRATGRKGQCLFVDSSRCFHAGSRVMEGCRLVIMVQFIKPNCVLEPKKSPWSKFIDKNPAVVGKIDKKKRRLLEKPIWG